MHTCSLKSPVRSCALVSLEAKQKLCAVLPPRGVARIKRQDLQKAGWHRGKTPAYAQMPLCELCSLGFGRNSKWACYATCCGSFWVLPMHSGKRAEEDPAASSHPTQAFQSVAFYCSDPSTHWTQEPTCPLSWINQLNMGCCCVQHCIILQEGQGSFQGTVQAGGDFRTHH